MMMKIEFEASCSLCGSEDLMLVNGNVWCRECEVFVYVELKQGTMSPREQTDDNG